jgi:hypothetical protein
MMSPMAEDWRLTVTLHEEGLIGRLLLALHERELEDELRASLGGRVAVSGSGNRLFLYANSEEAVRQVAQVVREVLAEHGIQGELEIHRWHPLEESWEDPSVPLPRTPADRQAELERREQEEAAESLATGLAAWEVRVELPSHADAVALAERLGEEGYSVVRRWTYLLIGAENEKAARALARRLRREAPAGARVQVEPGGGLVWELLPRNPFAIFGGLAG